MQSMIICEGSTNFILLQYFMRKVHEWEDTRERPQQSVFDKARVLQKGERKLVIGSTGGCDKIHQTLETLIAANRYGSDQKELIDNIVIVTDRDELSTETAFLDKVKNILLDKEIEYTNEIQNNKWLRCKCMNGSWDKVSFQICVLIIPFEETGAMETFLLHAIAKDNEYDKEIVEKANTFVDEIDPQKRYLMKRRQITKAKFDVYFSIRTSAEQFVQRQDILKGVKWENYLELQDGFAKLGDL